MTTTTKPAPKATTPTEPPATAAFRVIVDKVRVVRGRMRLVREELETARRFQSASEERLDEGRDEAYTQVEKATRRVAKAEAELRAMRGAETRLLGEAIEPARAYREELALSKRTAEHRAAVKLAEAIEAARATLTEATANGAPIDPALLPVARLSIDVPRTIPRPLEPFEDPDARAFDAATIRVEQRDADRDALTLLAKVLRDDVKVPTRSAVDTVAALAGVDPERVEGTTMRWGAPEDEYTIVATLELPEDDDGLVRAARIILDRPEAKAA